MFIMSDCYYCINILVHEYNVDAISSQVDNISEQTPFTSQVMGGFLRVFLFSPGRNIDEMG